MIRTLISWIAPALAAVLCLSATANALEDPCGGRPPTESGPWINFATAVENNYGYLDEMTPTERMIVYGHALARFEAGAGGPLDAECVRNGLISLAFDETIMGDPTDYNKIWGAAEQGQYDRQVTQLTGVNSREPFTWRDISRRDPGIAAGPEFRAQVSMSGDNFTPGITMGEFDNEEDDAFGPNYDDLPFTPNNGETETPAPDPFANSKVSCRFTAWDTCACEFKEGWTAKEYEEARMKACY